MTNLLARSLLARTVTLICAPLLLIVAAAVAAAISYSSQDARRALAERGRQTVALLTGSAAEALWNIDVAGAQTILTPLLQDPDFVGVRIIDADGSIFYQLGAIVPQRAGLIIEQTALFRGGVFAGQPAPSRQIGVLALQLADDRAEHEIFVRAVSIAAVGFSLAALTCGLLAALMAGVTAPIKTMTESMTALAAGRVDVALVPVDRSDELGRMAAALATLKLHAVERLGYIERQALHVEEIERTVAERTATLRETLETLQRAQDELVRSEKLAALGGMVAAIAHEINTPLGNGLTVATTLSDKAAEFRQAMEGRELRRSFLREYADGVVAACGLLTSNLLRAADLIGRFKRVAVDQTGEVRRIFALDAVCGEIVAMLGPSYKHARAQIVLDLPAGVTMDGYPGALGQVLTNLVANAMTHGFGDGTREGQVTISAVFNPGDSYVTLAVADDGAGAPAAALPRLFDPFFTTRLGSGGSGLGLHIVYAIVTRVLGGTISVESELGVGTRFAMVLPLKAPRPEADAEDGTV